MSFDFYFYAMAIPAIFFAGISKGGFGSGASFAATPFLALVVEPALAVGFLLPLLMIMDAASIRAFWGQWSLRDARALMIGSTPGIIAGALLYGFLNADMLRLLIGVIAVGFVAFQLCKAKGLIDSTPRPFRFDRAIGWGAVAGFTSFISHAGGPPAAVHLLGQNLSKTQFQATTVIVFGWINLVKVPAFFSVGLMNLSTLGVTFLLAPIALLGVFAGVRAHHLIPERVFFAITYVLLTITGAKLIFDALI